MIWSRSKYIKLLAVVTTVLCMVAIGHFSKVLNHTGMIIYYGVGENELISGETVRFYEQRKSNTNVSSNSTLSGKLDRHTLGKSLLSLSDTITSSSIASTGTSSNQHTNLHGANIGARLNRIDPSSILFETKTSGPLKQGIIKTMTNKHSPIKSGRHTADSTTTEEVTPTKLARVRTNFSLDTAFTFPWQKSKPLDYIQKQPWFEELTTFLTHSVPDSPIVLVCSDENFQDALLNWLISAVLKPKDPLANILVVTNTPSICRMINFKEVAKCISVNPNTFDGERLHFYYRLLVTRVALMRLLNYWGYDVANFDSDAVLLKNPVPIFKSEEYCDSDVVGTFGGTMPIKLRDKWGVVLCMGAILLRSTNRTELLWETMRSDSGKDDQRMLNQALDNMNISWTNRIVNPNDSRDRLSTVWTGKADGGLKVTLLPQRVACRGRGCRPDTRKTAYIWHHGQNKHHPKTTMEKAAEDGAWFLRDDWNTVPRRFIGLDWLKRISTLN